MCRSLALLVGTARCALLDVAKAKEVKDTVQKDYEELQKRYDEANLHT